MATYDEDMIEHYVDARARCEILFRDCFTDVMLSLAINREYNHRIVIRVACEWRERYLNTIKGDDEVENKAEGEYEALTVEYLNIYNSFFKFKSVINERSNQ